MAGNAKTFYVIFKRRFIAEMFSAFSRLFIWLGFHLHCAYLAVHFPLFDFREFVASSNV